MSERTVDPCNERVAEKHRREAEKRAARIEAARRKKEKEAKKRKNK